MPDRPSTHCPRDHVLIHFFVRRFVHRARWPQLDRLQERKTNRLPFVTLKIAQSLDGRIATATGHSRWITGRASRAAGHALRASHDAVLVGIGTVLVDDPELTVRLTRGNNPVRVVLDSRLRLPGSAALLRNPTNLTIIMTTRFAPDAQVTELERAGADVVRVADRSGRVDLESALENLRDRGVRSVLIEGGSAVATDALKRRLVDEVAVFIAPKLIGAGVQAIGELEVRTIDEALTFEEQSFELLNEDIVFKGRVAGSTRRAPPNNEDL